MAILVVTALLIVSVLVVGITIEICSIGFKLIITNG